MPIITSAQSGTFSDPDTWVGGVVPDSDDNAIIATGHIVTQTGFVTLLDATVQGTGVYTITGIATRLTITAGLLDIEAGATVNVVNEADLRFTSNADIILGNDATFNVSGSTPADTARSIIEATSGFTFTVQSDGTVGVAPNLTWENAIFRRLGRSNTTGNHAVEFPDMNGNTLTFECTNVLFDSYWRFQIGTISDCGGPGSTYFFDNCDFRNPLHENAFEYSMEVNFDAGAFRIFDSTFVGSITNLRRIAFSPAGTTWSNPFQVLRCVGADVAWENTGGANIEFGNATEYGIFTGTIFATWGTNPDVTISAGGDGNGKLMNSIILTQRIDTDMVTITDGASNNVNVSNNYFEATAANHAIVFECEGIYNNNIIHGGHAFTTRVAGTDAFTIQNNTHINTSGTYRFALHETNLWAANSLDFRNNISFGMTGILNQEAFVSDAGTQDYNYADYNGLFSIEDQHVNITAVNNTLTEGVDTGFGANNVTVDPEFSNQDWTLQEYCTEVWGNSAVTSTDLLSDALGVNGYDYSGFVYTKVDYHTLTDLILASARLAYTPTAAQYQNGIGGHIGNSVPRVGTDPLLLDNFAGTSVLIDLTLLSHHIPDRGHRYVRHYWYWSNLLQTNLGVLEQNLPFSSNPNGGVFPAVLLTGHTIQFNFITDVIFSGRMGVLWHSSGYQVTEGIWYEFVIDGTDWELNYVSGGVSTTLDSVLGAVEANTTYEIGINTDEDGDIVIYIDGVETLRATHTTRTKGTFGYISVQNNGIEMSAVQSYAAQYVGISDGCPGIISDMITDITLDNVCDLVT
jgi:hypothetical protein